MWMKLVPILLKLLTSVVENVVQWWLATEIKGAIMKFMDKKKKKNDNRE